MNEAFYEEYHKQGVLEGNEHALARLHRVLGFVRGKVLDAGCGYGVVVKELRARGLDCDGADISSVAIGRCRAFYPDASFFVHDFAAAPTVGRYDTIISFEVIEHVFYYKRFLKNLRASLNAGGTLILSTPNIFGLASWLKLLARNASPLFDNQEQGHVLYFDFPSLEKALEECGFQLEKREGYSLHPNFLPVTWQGNIIVVATKK